MKILYYDGQDQAKGKLVETVLRDTNIPFTMITSEDGNQTITALCGLAPKKASCPTSLPELDLMIFHEVDDETIQAISKCLKEHNAHVARKCVVTQHNQHWRFGDLLQEIMEEHAYFELYDTCKNMIMEVQTLKESTYTSTSWQVYQDAFMQALMLLQEGQPPKEMLEQAIQKMQTAKASLQLK